MRITVKEQKAIVYIARQFFDETAEVYLFGSRVDDNKKGGDIDIASDTKLSAKQ